MLVRQYLYLSELSRLQGNFPYSSPDHSFFVACYKTANGPGSIQKDTIIGFVDVDARPGTKVCATCNKYTLIVGVNDNLL